MTVNTTNITSGPYSGNGVTVNFSYTFRADLKSQVSVYVKDAAGVITTKTVDSDYTISGLGDDDGGTITFGTAPVTGETVYIRSNYTYTQLTDFDSQGGFFPDTHESAFDKLTFLIQQLLDKVGRAIRISDNDDTGDLDTLATLTPGSFLQVNNDADGFDLVTLGTVGVTAEVALTDYDQFRDNTGGFTVGDYSDGQVIYISGAEIAGAFVLRTGATPADDGGYYIRSNVDTNRYIERIAEDEWASISKYNPNGDGSTNDASFITAAQGINKTAQLGRDTYAVDGLTMSSDAEGIAGIGNRSSILEVTTTSPNFGITHSADYHYFENMRIQGSGKNLVQAGVNSYYNNYTNVWFGPSDLALDINGDFYWSNFVACHFRDNYNAITCDTGQDFNAVTFLGGSFYHFNAGAAGYSVDVFGGDGVAFMGTHVQNQGMRFDTMDGVEIAGGYWECYDVPTIDAIDSQISISGGMYFPNASRFKFDKQSIDKLNGYGPNLQATDAGGTNFVDNGSQKIAPVAQEIHNLFPDTDCSTQTAVEAIKYSPTGLTGTESINADGHLECAFTLSTQRNGFIIRKGVGNISVFAKWRATSGIGRCVLGNVTNAVGQNHDSGADSDWRYFHAHSVNENVTITNITNANPAVVTYSGSDVFTNGNVIRIKNVNGMPEVNGQEFTVANLNTTNNTFELSGVDSTSFGTYVSKGLAENTTSYVIWQSQDGNPATIEIDMLIISDKYMFLRENSACIQGDKGTATLSSGTASITFDKQKHSADYQIQLTGDANETFYFSSKAATGFTINSSNGSSTANVDWVVKDS